MSVTIVPDAESEAVLRLKSLESLPMPLSVAFNGIPFDYHHAEWYFREMGIDRTHVARRWLDELRAVGVSVAMEPLSVAERSVCVRKEMCGKE